MSTTDELLEEMLEDAEEYATPVADDDLQFWIDEHLRVISIPKNGVVAGVEGDKNVNKIKFGMNRYYHGFDMSTFSGRILYSNAKGNKNYYNITDMQTSGNIITFSWLVDADAVQYTGKTAFVVYLFKAQGSELRQKFYSTLATLKVLEGMEVDSAVPVEKQTDIIERMKEEISAYAEEVKKSLPADYTAMTEQVNSLKEDLGDISKGHFASGFEPLKSSGISVTDTVDGRKHNLQWDISSGSAYRGFLVSKNISNWTNKKIIAKVTNNSATSIIVDSAHLRILLSHSENWGLSIDWYTGELNAYETKNLELTVKDKNYDEAELWFVVGGTVAQGYGTANISFELFVFDSKAEQELNADTLENLSVKQITKQITDDVANILSQSKEDLADISKGHFASGFEPLKSAGISVTDTVDGRKHNLQWNISSGSAYRGFLISENISNWTNKKIIAKVTNNSATSIVIDNAHLRMLLSRNENWGSPSPIDWYKGELNAYETKRFELTVKDKSYDESGLWFVVGGTVAQGYGTANISFELFVFDSKAERELNADTLENLSVKQITKQITDDAANILSQSNKIIDCYGDSLTQGAPVYGDLTYPAQLKLLVGDKYTVNQQGIGGNTVQDILARQGAYLAVVAPFTIPADSTPVNIVLTSSQDGRLIRWAQNNLATKVNPVYINGVEGTLVETTDDSDVYHYTFSRKEAGNEVEIKRPTFLITSKSLTTKEDIQILWIGQNGKWNSEDELVEMFKAAISHMSGLQKRYICVGLSSGTKESRATLERKMSVAFGNHYINIRDYLVAFGLDDAGISATDQDKQDISSGKVPTSLRADGVHFTADGYKVIAKVIYQRGKELGYWD